MPTRWIAQVGRAQTSQSSWRRHFTVITLKARQTPALVYSSAATSVQAGNNTLGCEKMRGMAHFETRPYAIVICSAYWPHHYVMQELLLENFLNGPSGWSKSWEIVDDNYCGRPKQMSPQSYIVHSVGRRNLLGTGKCPFVCISPHSGTSPCKYLRKIIYIIFIN